MSSWRTGTRVNHIAGRENEIVHEQHRSKELKVGSKIHNQSHDLSKQLKPVIPVQVTVTKEEILYKSGHVLGGIKF